jgi:hypothetical protein
VKSLTKAERQPLVLAERKVGLTSFSLIHRRISIGSSKDEGYHAD